MEETATWASFCRVGQAGPPDIFHLKRYRPFTKPLILVLGLVGLAITAAFGPDTCDQDPVPMAGTFPTRAVDVILHPSNCLVPPFEFEGVTDVITVMD
jgi:hypothetical protein